MSADEHHEPSIARQIGGHKATLHNPSSSEAAKEHSKSVLKEHGIDVKETDGVISFEQHPTHDGHYDTRGHVHPRADGETEEQHQHRVLGGFKATLSNPRTSDEAKEHAREKLREAGENV